MPLSNEFWGDVSDKGAIGGDGDTKMVLINKEDHRVEPDVTSFFTGRKGLAQKSTCREGSVDAEEVLRKGVGPAWSGRHLKVQDSVDECMDAT